MRGLKSTIGLVVVLIGLGAYAYYGIYKKPEAPGKEKVFAGVTDQDIVELRVKSSKGDLTTLKRQDSNEWSVLEPIRTKADLPVVAGTTGALAGLEVQRVIDEKPSGLKDYGLDPPKFEVEFKTAKDKDWRKLLVGEKSPTGVDLFAMRAGDGRVFLIQSYLDSSFDKSTFDLRDKSLVTFDRDKVDAIDLTKDGRTVRIAREGGEWAIVKPYAAKADFGAVEGLIGQLQHVQMKSIEKDQAAPADLKAFGLDKPRVTAVLTIGSAKATLDFGADAGTNTNTVYVRDQSKPMVMTVEVALRDQLEKGVDEYRRKDVFEFRAFNAEKVELTRDGQTTVFEKTKGSGENPQDKWRRVSPNPKDVDRDAMDGMLVKFANMRAASFVESAAKTGLDKPALTVTVTFDPGKDGKKTEQVTFGKAGADVYAGRKDAPGAAKIDATDFTEALKALDELSK